jgi:hypothetical protein
MSRSPVRRRHPGHSIAIVALVALGLFGCDGDPPVRARIFDPLPEAVTPVAAVRAFDWTWEHQDSTAHEALLSDAFRFAFALGDSSGNGFPGHAMPRDTFVCAVNRLFDASRSLGSPAPHIVVNWLSPLQELPDSRPGRHPDWHREVPVSYHLSAATIEGTFSATGQLRFFLVRGDSAGLPGGSSYDPSLWYLDEIHDESQVDPVLRIRPVDTTPATSLTLGSILARFRCP